jgi:peptide/nickel transport system permease protein
MLTFIARRMLRALLTLAICVTAVFVVLRLAGDPTDILLPDDTLPEVKAEYRERWASTDRFRSSTSAF